jgi:hypothetical protein
MNEILNLVAQAVLEDSTLVRVALIVSGFLGLAHFGFRTLFMPLVTPYLLRLACATTAILSGALMFSSVNAPQLLVLFLGSLTAMFCVFYDILAWHYGVDVSNCFKCPKNKINLLNSLKDQKG